MTATPAVRRAAIFGGAFALGLVLVVLLADRGPRRRAGRPVIEVVDIPAGTPIPSGPGGRSGIRIVAADSPEARPFREVALDDGTRVPFRPWTLRGSAHRPLPAPEDTVRVAIDAPDAVMRREPRTAADSADPDRGALRIRADHGVLESGNDGRRLLRLDGEVRARTDRRGDPWDFEADDATADMRARTLASAGAVSVASRGVRAGGTGLDAVAGPPRRVRILREASGSLEKAPGGTGAGPAAPLRFSCTGPLLLEDLPAAPDGAERFRIVLEVGAVVEQEGSHLSADRIEIEAARLATGEVAPDRLVASGTARIRMGREGREIEGAAHEIVAVPAAGDATEVRLRGEPRIRMADAAASVAATGTGDARFVVPRGAGRATATLDHATAVQSEIVGRQPAERRTLRGERLVLEADRDADGALHPRSMAASGNATLDEQGRRASGRTLTVEAREGGGHRAVLEGDVAASLPYDGGLDPLSEAPDPARPAGSLVVRTPGRLVMDLESRGEVVRPSTIAADGGVVLTRIEGERETYRLVAKSARVVLRPLTRAVERMEADGNVVLTGRDEAGRRYDLHGERLLVTTTGDGRGAGETMLLGPAPGEPAVANLVLEDGRPGSIAARALVFDRASGRFRAEGDVRAVGVLPSSATAGTPLPGGPATLRAAALRGVLRSAPGGRSAVAGLEADGPVALRTATEEATGDALAFDDATGEAVLRGAPARVSGPAAGAPEGSPLRDLVEAPVLRIVLGAGRLERATAEGGARVVRHRFVPGAPAQRLEARCAGPLVHGRRETTLGGPVTLARSLEAGGVFGRGEEADGIATLRIEHEDSGGLRAATATGGPGGAVVRNPSAGWTASGVASARFEAGAGTLALEAAPGTRLVLADASGSRRFRRCVFDTAAGILKESVGGALDGER